MDNLLEAINEHYHTHGKYPNVKVTRTFALENHFVMAELVDLIEIDDTLNENWRLV